ncbi:hypothetical protein CCHR01_16715 [Colletotrichum chrysophilum]|uniref:Uncharacterized protein n=1 Tax=Colletotrichum chrysophilum TaxID=1836956 RepID=A0AAD9A7Y3_9PEZI|nr:hypothetical protein CCHR01_16715 [Colletotrichum chrysophilum]
MEMRRRVKPISRAETACSERTKRLTAHFVRPCRTMDKAGSVVIGREAVRGGSLPRTPAAFGSFLPSSEDGEWLLHRLPSKRPPGDSETS